MPNAGRMPVTEVKLETYFHFNAYAEYLFVKSFYKSSYKTLITSY